MKLTELKPRWITLNGWSAPDPFYIGLSFLCPHCHPDLPESGAVRIQRLAISFWPPIDPANWMSRINKLPRSPEAWDRIGETFENISLSPSVDTSQHNHWHGSIINGEIK